MGYSTQFYGKIMAEPAFSKEEKEFLDKFCQTRRCKRKDEILEGSFYVCKNPAKENWGQGCQNIMANNDPPSEQPGLWCQWVISDDLEGIEWDGGEKFYDAAQWMDYLIKFFFDKRAIAPKLDGKLAFLKKHKLNGEILCVGEETGDIWKLIVKNNKVMIAQGKQVSLIKEEDFEDEDTYYDALYDQHSNLNNINDPSIQWSKTKEKINIAILKETSVLVDSLKTKNKIEKNIKVGNKKDYLKI